MLWNYPDLNIPKPCNECTIVRQWAGLEYPDGKNANIDTGMWLHHMVQLTIGPGRWDPTCYGSPSLPHIDVNSSPQASERYFSSGNERTHIDLDILGAEKTKWGYHIKRSDNFGFIVDLMNMNMQDKTVFLTMYYDVVDGPLPAGWDDIKVVWFDANQCGTSEIRPKSQSGSYNVASSYWRPNFEGRILGVGGHLHDGGVDLDIIEGKTKLCTSKASYGETKEYLTFGGKGGGHGGMAGMNNGHDTPEAHISRMTACYIDRVLPVTHVKKGQQWYVEAHYDYNKFQGMKDKGYQSEVMAIALMYVAVKPGVSVSNGFF